MKITYSIENTAKAIRFSGSLFDYGWTLQMPPAASKYNCQFSSGKNHPINTGNGKLAKIRKRSHRHQNLFRFSRSGRFFTEYIRFFAIKPKQRVSADGSAFFNVTFLERPFHNKALEKNGFAPD